MMRMKREKMKKENLKRRSLKKIVLDPKAKNKIPMLHLRTGEEKASGTCVWRYETICYREFKFVNSQKVILTLFFFHRIPLPELKDSDKLDKIMNMKETTKRVRLGPDCLPSICFYTFLNAYQVGKLIGWFLPGESCRMMIYH